VKSIDATKPQTYQLDVTFLLRFVEKLVNLVVYELLCLAAQRSTRIVEFTCPAQLVVCEQLLVNYDVTNHSAVYTFHRQIVSSAVGVMF
jgi:hypothetical protein